MKLLQVYECFCDETRLRILNLLSRTPLGVSHLQHVLQLTQVKISKHLAYLKEREMVEATRFENRVFYALTNSQSPELTSNLKCLQDCSHDYPIFKEDLQRLKAIGEEVSKMKAKVYQTKEP